MQPDVNQMSTSQKRLGDHFGSISCLGNQSRSARRQLMGEESKGCMQIVTGLKVKIIFIIILKFCSSFLFLRILNQVSDS